MKHITFIVCIVYIFFVVHDGNTASACVACSDVASAIGTMLGSIINFKITKTINRHKKVHVNKCPTKAKTDGAEECALSENDVVELFGSAETLANLTLAEKKTAVSALTGHCSGPSSVGRLPAGVAVNVVALFGSTGKLFAHCVSEGNLGTVLDIVAADAVLQRVPGDVRARFLDGYLQLSAAAYVKNCVSEPARRYLLETAASADGLRSLSAASVARLVTGMSLWRAFPAENFGPLLAHVAENPAEIFRRLPPSTVFGFVEGLLDALDGPAPGRGAVPYPAAGKVLRSAMTPRMLSVLPGRAFGLLVAVLGKRPALAKSLYAADFDCLFRTLKTSPVLLTAAGASDLAGLLTTVVTTPEIYDTVNATLLTGTMQSIADYVPYAIGDMPADVRVKLGFGKNVTRVC